MIQATKMSDRNNIVRQTFVSPILCFSSSYLRWNMFYWLECFIFTGYGYHRKDGPSCFHKLSPNIPKYNMWTTSYWSSFKCNVLSHFLEWVCWLTYLLILLRRGDPTKKYTILVILTSTLYMVNLKEYTGLTLDLFYFLSQSKLHTTQSRTGCGIG